nr:hypothetical protein [Shewanella indica]
MLTIDMSGAVTEDIDVINGMLSDSGDLSFTDVDINDSHSVSSSYNNDATWTNNPPLDQATQDALAAGFSVDNSGWNYEILMHRRMMSIRTVKPSRSMSPELKAATMKNWISATASTPRSMTP